MKAVSRTRNEPGPVMMHAITKNKHWSESKRLSSRVREKLSMLKIYLYILGVLTLSGCGTTVVQPAPLFAVPLAIEGNSVGSAIVDTGGGFEILLKENFGLDVVNTVDVIAYEGEQTVLLTEPFIYKAGGLETRANSGLVDPSICNCNGLGFQFLRKNALILTLDFAAPSVYFIHELPLLFRA